MAIRLITGVPGSGKTYYLVCQIIKDFCYKTKSDYLLKKDVTLITNIEDLKLPHINLDEILSKYNNDWEKFWSVDEQKKVIKKYGTVVYIVDEAQQFFNNRFRSQAIEYFWQYHRHLGIDIYFATQDKFLLPKSITTLIEFEYRCVKRSLSVFGEIKLNVLSNGEIVDRQILKKSKKIFNLYQSSIGKEFSKVKNPMVKYLVVIFISVIFASILFYKTFLYKAWANEPVKKEKVIEVEQNEIIKPTKDVKPSIAANTAPIPAPTPMKPRYYSVKVGWVKWENNIRILDPFTGEFLPPKRLPYLVEIQRIDGKMRCYALMSETQYQKLPKEGYADTLPPISATP